MTPSTQDARATGLVELAVRCEQATGADRELDALVAAAIRHFPVNVGYIWQGEMKANSPEVGCVECCTRSGTGGPWYKAKSYTASLDAAMTLVPEGRHTELAMQDRHSLRWKWSLRGGYGVRSEARAATPALALTAACLRALAASTKDMNHDG